MRRFDAIVIGGGPAGCAAAIRLARHGASVALLERSQYENWRAGETLPPHTRALLEQIGIGAGVLDEQHAACYGIYSAWGRAEISENDFILNPYGHGWHLDRARFDALLSARAAEAGAEVRRGIRVESVCRMRGQWQVAAAAPKPLEACAPVLVDATGRAARFARRTGARRIIYDQTIGMTGIYEPRPGAVTPSALMLEAAQDGWWYSAPLPGGALLVTFITDTDLFVRSGLSRSVFWGVHLGRTRHTLARTGDRALATPLRVTAAYTSRLTPLAGPGWVAAGDAASAYDPLAGIGIPKALQMGVATADAIRAQNSGDRGALDAYAARFERAFHLYIEQRRGYYDRENRWPNSPFWKRRRSGSSPAALQTETGVHAH